MASKALTKEQKSVVSTQKTGIRKRERERAMVSQIAGAVAAPMGAIAAAAADGATESGELEVGPVPVTPIVSALLAMGGLVVGGPVGSGVTGFGVGGLDAWLGRKVHAAIQDRKDSE